MWIPTPIYERVPQFWLLLGLLFMSSGVLLGFDYPISFVYFAAGFTCSGWSICLFVWRYRFRNAKKAVEESAPEESSYIVEESTAHSAEQPEPG